MLLAQNERGRINNGSFWNVNLRDDLIPSNKTIEIFNLTCCISLTYYEVSLKIHYNIAD